MKIIALALLMVGISGALTVQAQAPAQGRAGSATMLQRFDTNGDGKIDADERAAIRQSYYGDMAKRGRMEPKPGVEVIDGRKVSELQFDGPDGRKLRAVLSVPVASSGRVPLVVTIHGGQGDRDYGYLRTLAAPGATSPTVAMLNQQPWAVLTIDYRRGGGKIWEDVVAGIRFAKTLPGVNPDRVCAMGGSHGGQLVMLAAQAMAREFRCVIAGSPFMPNAYVYQVQDINTPPLSELSPRARELLLESRARMTRGATRSREELEAGSFETHADKIVIPTLILGSRADEQVPYPLLVGTIDRMKAAGREVSVFVATQVPHGFYWGRNNGGARMERGDKSAAELAEEEAARKAILAFLKKWLAT